MTSSSKFFMIFLLTAMTAHAMPQKQPFYFSEKAQRQLQELQLGSGIIDTTLSKGDCYNTLAWGQVMRYDRVEELAVFFVTAERLVSEIRSMTPTEFDQWKRNRDKKSLASKKKATAKLKKSLGNQENGVINRLPSLPYAQE